MKVERLISKESIVIVDNIFFQGDLINKLVVMVYNLAPRKI